MRFRHADTSGFGRPVETVVFEVQPDPHDADGIVGTCFERRLLIPWFRVPEQIRVVVKNRPPGDACDLPVADGQRIVLAAAGHRREQDQGAIRACRAQGRVFARHLNRDLAGRAVVHGLRGGVEGRHARHLDDAARDELDASVHADEQQRRGVKAFRQQFQHRPIFESRQIRLLVEAGGNPFGEGTPAVLSADFVPDDRRR